MSGQTFPINVRIFHGPVRGRGWRNTTSCHFTLVASNTMHVNHVIKGEDVHVASYLVNLEPTFTAWADLLEACYFRSPSAANVNSPLVHEEARPRCRERGWWIMLFSCRRPRRDRRHPLAPRPSIATHATAAKLLYKPVTNDDIRLTAVYFNEWANYWTFSYFPDICIFRGHDMGTQYVQSAQEQGCAIYRMYWPFLLHQESLFHIIV